MGSASQSWSNHLDWLRQYLRVCQRVAAAAVLHWPSWGQLWPLATFSRVDQSDSTWTSWHSLDTFPCWPGKMRDHWRRVSCDLERRSGCSGCFSQLPTWTWICSFGSQCGDLLPDLEKETDPIAQFLPQNCPREMWPDWHHWFDHRTRCRNPKSWRHFTWRSTFSELAKATSSLQWNHDPSFWIRFFFDSLLRCSWTGAESFCDCQFCRADFVVCTNPQCTVSNWESHKWSVEIQDSWWYVPKANTCLAAFQDQARLT